MNKDIIKFEIILRLLLPIMCYLTIWLISWAHEIRYLQEIAGVIFVVTMLKIWYDILKMIKK